VDDAFAALLEVADELGHDPATIPAVSRHPIDAGEVRLSVLVWDTTEPEIVFLHGGGQNAHTWDLVAMDLGRPAIAIDLPGHGHSSWRSDHDYGPARNADPVAAAIELLAPNALAVVGMSLGGLTTMCLARVRPDLVRRAVLVDVTPATVATARRLTAEQRGSVALITGPHTFNSLDEMAAAAVQASPGRLAAATRRGVVHNAQQLPDERWQWRYDPVGASHLEPGPLWEYADALTMPTMLVKGADSAFVTPADLAEFTHRVPTARVEVVSGAGHAVQSDQPQALTALIRDFVFGDAR
jgi:esterase